MLAAPCTPPRRGIRFGFPRSKTTFNLAGLALRHSRSDTLLNRRLSEDPAIHLEALLRHHNLPETHALSPTRQYFGNDIPENVPSSHLRCSESLLSYISRHLAEVSSLLAPQQLSPMVPGPSKVDTDRFAEIWDGLSESARLSANARRLFSSPIKEADFMIKFFLRPANELMACMFMTTGYQVFWRLAIRHLGNTPRLELVWRTSEIDESILCVLAATTPEVVADSDMQILIDHLRRGLLCTNEVGSIVMYSPEGREVDTTWMPACKLASRGITDMADNSAGLAIISNCNRFSVISRSSEGGMTIFNFSDLVNVSGVPDANNFCKSPLALILGVAVHGLHGHGLKLSRNSRGTAIPRTSLVVDNLLLEHFGPNLASKRHSHDVRLRRRAVYGIVMYPSHLGACLLRLRAQPSLLDIWNAPSFCWTSPFHGPFEFDARSSLPLPHLSPEATPDETSWIPELEVIDFRGAGRIWNVFTVRFHWLKSSDPDVVAKVVDLTQFPELSGTPGSLNRNAASTAIKNELGLFSGVLRELQGSVVPRFRGLLGSTQPDGTQQWCALFDDAGVPLSSNERRSPVVRSSIRRHYEALHETGVIHNDIGWDNILHRDEAGIMIIDFDQAVARTSESDAEWARRCASEMEEVDLLLSCGAFPTGA